MDPAEAQHCAEANQLLNWETLLRVTWDLQGQQIWPHPNKGATELCSHSRWHGHTAQTSAQGAQLPRRCQTLGTHALCTHAGTGQPVHNCTGASASLMLCVYCREPEESASTWASPAFWGFLVTWKSLTALWCSAELISCLWTTCPRTGKVLVSRSYPARAILQLCWASMTDAAAKLKWACSVSCPHPQHWGYSGFPILWAHPKLHLPLYWTEQLTVFPLIYFPSAS